VSAAQGRQGHASGVTPWSALPSLSGWLGVGVEKTTLWTGVADMRGQVAATTSKGGEARGRGRCVADAWGPAAVTASEQRTRGRGRRAADAWGLAAVTASERRTRGRGRRVLGRKLGRARALGEGGRGWLAGWRGGAGRAVKPSGLGP